MQRDELIWTSGGDAAAMTRSLLERSDIEALPRAAKIGIKPNLVVAKAASSGATTHVEIVRAAIKFLQERGFESLVVLESSWVGDRTKRAFAACGYDALSRETGVPLVDVKDDRYEVVTRRGVRMEISRTALELDYLISVPVLKGHCQTRMTCALKNMKGCLSDRSKRDFHARGLHRPIAALGSALCADLVLVDGLCGDLDFEEGGNPVPAGRMILGRDSVLVDSFGASLLGFDWREIEYIALAQEFGVGSADLSRARITALGERGARPAQANPARRVRALERHVAEDGACSACYANLIHALARLEEGGRLPALTEKVRVGQGWRGKKGGRIGAGNCAAGCARSAAGCPPDAARILRMLEEETGGA